MYIKRTILKDLIAHLPKKEISLIIGPRQAGKTTLMLQMQEELKKQEESCLFFSLDFEKDSHFFQSQSSLIDRIRLEVGQKKAYIFIDEIQRKADAGLFLKGIYDMQLPYKFIVSGSGSLELKEKIHESLPGRKQVFEVNTLSFQEFVNYKTAYRYEDNLHEYFRINAGDGQRFLMEYMNFGGYPRVVLEETAADKTRVIDDIFVSYIEKDISYFLKVEKIDAFRNLIRMLSSQSGSLVNINTLASDLGVSAVTVKNYLGYAEKTFIIRPVTPFFRNTKKEITKSPVMYFNDIGMRNFSAGRFGNYSMFSEMGFLFQNFIFNLLRDTFQYQNVSIHFWRTKDRAEVDFVIQKGISVIPVEVKCTDMKNRTIGRPLRSFMEKYTPREAWIINLSLQDKEKVGRTLVRFIPFSMAEMIGERG